MEIAYYDCHYVNYLHCYYYVYYCLSDCFGELGLKLTRGFVVAGRPFSVCSLLYIQRVGIRNI